MYIRDSRPARLSTVDELEPGDVYYHNLHFFMKVDQRLHITSNVAPVGNAAFVVNLTTSQVEEVWGNLSVERVEGEFVRTL